MLVKFFLTLNRVAVVRQLQSPDGPNSDRVNTTVVDYSFLLSVPLPSVRQGRCGYFRPVLCRWLAADARRTFLSLLQPRGLPRPFRQLRALEDCRCAGHRAVSWGTSEEGQGDRGALSCHGKSCLRLVVWARDPSYFRSSSCPEIGGENVEAHRSNVAGTNNPGYSRVIHPAAAQSSSRHPFQLSETTGAPLELPRPGLQRVERAAAAEQRILVNHPATSPATPGEEE